MAKVITLTNEQWGEEDVACGIIKDIFEYMTDLSKKSAGIHPVKLYFSGEFDSNQTDFERKSNHLEIGVTANNETVGLALLRLLRIIIDEYPNLFWSTLEGVYEETNLAKPTSKGHTIEDIVKCFAESEETYMSAFGFDEKLTVTLCGHDGRFAFNRNLDEVDIWSRSRIQDALVDMY